MELASHPRKEVSKKGGTPARATTVMSQTIPKAVGDGEWLWIRQERTGGHDWAPFRIQRFAIHNTIHDCACTKRFGPKFMDHEVTVRVLAYVTCDEHFSITSTFHDSPSINLSSNSLAAPPTSP